MSSYYISPLGSGTKDGSSIANAATLAQLPGALQKVGAGGSVLLLADRGSYSPTSPLILKAGGTSSAPITIKGIDGYGNAMDAQFVGTRAQNWSSGAAEGQDVFRLMNGASNLSFENLSFKDVANAVRVGADISNLSIRHASAQNVAHFLENYVSGENTSATISGLVVDDVAVAGYSKSVVRLQYDSHDILIRNTIGDSKGIDGGFAIGVHLDGTVHDVLLSYVTMQNNVYTGTSYWNGDGFATERDVYNVRFDHTVARGNGDSGYDIKSASTVLDGAVAEGNNRNFRFWDTDSILMNAQGVDPYHSGGTASQAQIWLADNAAVKVINSSFIGSNAGTAVFNLDQSRSTLTLENVTVGMDDGAQLSRLFSGSTIKGTPVLLPHSDGIMSSSASSEGKINAVYRFYDTATKDHFYTTSTSEKSQILATLPTYRYEGVLWATPDDGIGTVDVFRFYNKAQNNHFYTTDAAERDYIISHYQSYQYEGVAFQSYADAGPDVSGSLTLQRFYNQKTDVHHYSASAGETAWIKGGGAGEGWVDEGPGFNVHVPTAEMLHL